MTEKRFEVVKTYDKRFIDPWSEYPFEFVVKDNQTGELLFSKNNSLAELCDILEELIEISNEELKKQIEDQIKYIHQLEVELRKKGSLL